MKKLITILAIAILTLGCSKDDDHRVIIDTTNVDCYKCTMQQGTGYWTGSPCLTKQELEIWKQDRMDEGFKNIKCTIR